MANFNGNYVQVRNERMVANLVFTFLFFNVFVPMINVQHYCFNGHVLDILWVHCKIDKY
jgi:hypothetical protein